MFFFSYSHVAKIESEISIEINYFIVEQALVRTFKNLICIVPDDITRRYILALFYSNFDTWIFKSSTRVFQKSFQSSNILFSYSEYLYSLQTLKFRYLNPNTRFPDNRSNHRMFFSHISNVQKSYSRQILKFRYLNPNFAIIRVFQIIVPVIECSFFIFAYHSKIESEISIKNNYFSTNFGTSISKFRWHTFSI